jgi:deoxyribodipyrimidine photolyase-related protein
MKARRITASAEGVVVFPHQLFSNHPSLKPHRPVFLVEDPLFFEDTETAIRFHKKKLVLHRASMKSFQKDLEARSYTVVYLDYPAEQNQDHLFKSLKNKGIKALFLSDPVDSRLEKKLFERAKAEGLRLFIDPSPGFLSSRGWISDFFSRSSHYSLTSFYIAQRKRLGIMVQRRKPEGGRWTYDTLNRKPLPPGLKIPQPSPAPPTPELREAQRYVDRRFPNHPGSTGPFFFAHTPEQARSFLQEFLQTRLAYFGDYQDAIGRDQAFLFHGLLSPALNIGLITPEEVLKETLAGASTQKVRIPLNALEGFIRQIIGWREFVRAVYLMAGEKERHANFWGHSRTLAPSFYHGTTGIEPVDTVIRRVRDHAYAHHIERLMVLGNFMLLCEIDPKQVYRWFMEMFIDAYDWVMVPNVFGMSQYADGGLMTTKPYISSSRYILRMSDFSKGPWCAVWDALYWHFIDKHLDVFKKIPRLRVMAATLNKMSPEKRTGYLQEAEAFLKYWEEN